MEDLVNLTDALNSFAGRRVLVTGHTGFKGSWLCLWLTRLGAKVTGFSDNVTTDPSHFAVLQLDIDDRRGDVSDVAAVRAVIEEVQPEIVFHLAAQSLVRRAYADPVGTYRTNVLGTLAVLEASRASKVRALVSTTTDKVYRNREWAWGYRESDELGGSDPYSASKSCVELLTNSYRQSFLGGPDRMLVASVRAGNVIGGGDWAEDRLIPDIVRAAHAGEPVRIRNPQSTRPWQHVLDVLAGYLEVGGQLLAGDETKADAWNFGPLGQANIRVRDILDEVKMTFPDLEIAVEPEDEGRKESNLLQLDSTNARTQLHWQPRWESEMLERTLAWYRAYYQDGRVISAEQLTEYTSVKG